MILFQSLKSPARVAMVYAPFIALLALVILIDNTTRIHADQLMRDPAAITNVPFYIGSVSNVGVVVWIIGAAVCLFTASTLSARGIRDEWFRMFRYAGWLTAALGLDDLFMFHEEIFPKYLFPKGGWLHLSEKIVFLGYIFGFGTLFVRFRKTLLRTDITFLFLGFGLLGLAMVSDQGFVKHVVPSKTARLFLEDGLKLLGIVGWSSYFVMTARSILTNPHPADEP
jgi:hypothetical protein